MKKGGKEIKNKPRVIFSAEVFKNWGSLRAFLRKNKKVFLETIREVGYSKEVEKRKIKSFEEAIKGNRKVLKRILDYWKPKKCRHTKKEKKQKKY